MLQNIIDELLQKKLTCFKSIKRLQYFNQLFKIFYQQKSFVAIDINHLQSQQQFQQQFGILSGFNKQDSNINNKMSLSSRLLQLGIQDHSTVKDYINSCLQYFQEDLNIYTQKCNTITNDFKGCGRSIETLRKIRLNIDVRYIFYQIYEQQLTNAVKQYKNGTILTTTQKFCGTISALYTLGKSEKEVNVCLQCFKIYFQSFQIEVKNQFDLTLKRIKQLQQDKFNQMSPQEQEEGFKKCLQLKKRLQKKRKQKEKMQQYRDNCFCYTCGVFCCCRDCCIKWFCCLICM